MRTRARQRSMTDLDALFVAVRLLAVGAVVLLVPGLTLLHALQLKIEWHLRVVLALSVSYSWVFLLSVLLPLCGWTVDAAALLTLLGLAALGVMIGARRRTHPSTRDRPPKSHVGGMFILAAIALWVALAWIIEPPFTGEEALDLISAWRFADGGPITFDTTSLFPATRPVYLFQPYQLAVGAVARWSGTEPIVALIKFRALLAPLTLVCVYALLRILTSTRADAVAAFVVVLLFVVLDMNTWEWNSLFPFVRRGGVGAGICAPVMLALCLLATRPAPDPHSRIVRCVALTVAPLMLLASLATHPLEMAPLLWFVVGLTVAILTGLDRSGARKPAVLLVLLLSAATVFYVTVQARAVPYVAEYERADKLALRRELRELAGDPVRAIIGGPTEARDLWSRTIPATTVVIAGIPALALAVLRTPPAAAVLALGVVPLALLYASPAGFIVLKLVTSVETVKDVDAYFGLLGLLALALALTAVAHACLNAAAWRAEGLARAVVVSAAGSLVLWVAWTGGRGGMRWIAEEVIKAPEILLIAAVVTGAFVISVAAHRRTLLNPAPFPLGLILLTAALALPFAAPDWAFGGIFAKRVPVTLIDRLREADSSPSVREWPAYYEELKQTYSASLSRVPRELVDALRTRIPHRQIVLAHPRYSCDLAMLIDANCINPERIPGHYYQPAAAYLTKYVARRDGQPPEHPFFNGSSSLDERERSLLRDYRISYVLADPEYAAQIGTKLASADVRALLELEQSGFRLYRISQP
jgi:hypothetical protein